MSLVLTFEHYVNVAAGMLGATSAASGRPMGWNGLAVVLAASRLAWEVCQVVGHLPPMGGNKCDRCLATCETPNPELGPPAFGQYTWHPFDAKEKPVARSCRSWEEYSTAEHEAAKPQPSQQFVAFYPAETKKQPANIRQDFRDADPGKVAEVFRDSMQSPVMKEHDRREARVANLLVKLQEIASSDANRVFASDLILCAKVALAEWSEGSVHPDPSEL